MKSIFFLLLFAVSLVFCSCSNDDNNMLSKKNEVNMTEMDNMVHELIEKRVNTVTRAVSKKEIFEICKKYQVKSLSRGKYSLDSTNGDYEDFLSDKTLEELIASLAKEKQESLIILSTYALDRPMYQSYEQYKKSLCKKIEDKDNLALVLMIADFIEQNKDILNEFSNSVSRYSIQSRANLSICDYCAAGASVVIGDLAVTGGMAGAIAGPLGISVGLAGGIIGALGGLAYYSAFC